MIGENGIQREWLVVEKTNPHFKAYVCEALSLRRVLQANQQKRLEP